MASVTAHRASVGAALGNRDLGRFSVPIQSDGDLMYAPGVLWTAARHKIPLLAVMHNNRGYHQEVMHIQRLSNFRNRVANIGNDLAPIGTSIMNPDIEYHELAKSMGWWAKGPITIRPILARQSRKRWQSVKVGPASAGQRRHPAPLRRIFMRFVCSFPWRRCLLAFVSSVAGHGVGACRWRRPEGQGCLHQEWLLAVPRLQGEGSVATSNGKVIARTQLPLDAFISFVHTTNGAMPPFRPQVLSDADLTDIYAYLQSLPEPKQVKDIPLLNNNTRTQ